MPDGEREPASRWFTRFRRPRNSNLLPGGQPESVPGPGPERPSLPEPATGPSRPQPAEETKGGRQARIRHLSPSGSPPKDHQFDILIIPDLIGAAENWEPSATSELATANPNARVFVYEYSLPQTSKGTIEITADGILSDAKSLHKASLESNRTTDGQTETKSSNASNRSDDTSGQDGSQTSKEGDQVPVILVACGYGGLLCELALVRELNTPNKSGFLHRACRLILVATPHFMLGLQQWARFITRHFAQRNNYRVGRRPRLNRIPIFNEQMEFRRCFEEGHRANLVTDRRADFTRVDRVSTDRLKGPDLKIACFFSNPTDPETPPATDRVWEILDFAYLVGVEAGHREIVDFFLLPPKEAPIEGGPLDGSNGSGDKSAAKDGADPSEDQSCGGKDQIEDENGSGPKTSEEKVDTGEIVTRKTKKFAAITQLIFELHRDGGKSDQDGGGDAADPLEALFLQFLEKRQEQAKAKSNQPPSDAQENARSGKGRPQKGVDGGPGASKSDGSVQSGGAASPPRQELTTRSPEEGPGAFPQEG